jgi:two-component system LytT family response regulator
LVHYSYLVVSDNEASVKETVSLLEDFPEYFCAGTATTREETINLVLEFRPQLVFLDIGSKKSDLTLSVITDLHQYITLLPHFVIVSETDKLALEAIKAGVFYYLLKPLATVEMRKCLFKFRKQSAALLPYDKAENIPITGPDTDDPDEKPDTETQKSEIDIQICIKSYGDYQFIALKDVVYLEADNNTTDFYLYNGKKLSAYKTLKHYENNLPSFFFRIHNSYIVNSSYVSRINTGKQLCYLNNNDVSVSFSKTFKENIDTIIKKIAPEYL